MDRRQEASAVPQVVDRHARRLYRAARGLGFSGPDAEDLLQDVFVTFLQTLDRFEGRSAVSTWLFGILYRKAQERRRASARHDAHAPFDEAFEAQFDDRGDWIRPPVAPDRATVSREIAVALESCLEALPPRQRDVFHLRQVEELSAAEVSAVTSHTEGHVAVLLHRARQRLRECLERKGWGRPA